MRELPAVPCFARPLRRQVGWIPCLRPGLCVALHPVLLRAGRRLGKTFFRPCQSPLENQPAERQTNRMARRRPPPWLPLRNGPLVCPDCSLSTARPSRWPSSSPSCPAPPTTSRTTRKSLGRPTRPNRPSGASGSPRASRPASGPPSRCWPTRSAFCFDEQGRCYVAETFRLHHGVTDNRGHMNWLDDDLACAHRRRPRRHATRSTLGDRFRRVRDRARPHPPARGHQGQRQGRQGDGLRRRLQRRRRRHRRRRAGPQGQRLLHLHPRPVAAQGHEGRRARPT